MIFNVKNSENVIFIRTLELLHELHLTFFTGSILIFIIILDQRYVHK